MSHSYNLPHLKEIMFLSANQQRAEELLSGIDNSRNPYLLNLYSIDELPLIFLLFIQKTLKSNLKSLFYPYPVYILSQVQYPQIDILQFTSHKEIPRYFSAKETSSKVPAQFIKDKNNLLADLDRLNYENISKLLKQYQKENDHLYHLNYQNNYYKELLKKL